MATITNIRVRPSFTLTADEARELQAMARGLTATPTRTITLEFVIDRRPPRLVRPDTRPDYLRVVK